MAQPLSEKETLIVEMFSGSPRWLSPYLKCFCHIYGLFGIPKLEGDKFRAPQQSPLSWMKQCELLMGRVKRRWNLITSLQKHSKGNRYQGVFNIKKKPTHQVHICCQNWCNQLAIMVARRLSHMGFYVWRILKCCCATS